MLDGHDGNMPPLRWRYDADIWAMPPEAWLDGWTYDAYDATRGDGRHGSMHWKCATYGRYGSTWMMPPPAMAA